MSASSAELMAIGKDIQDKLRELFHKLHTPNAPSFPTFLGEVTSYKLPLKRFQVDFAACLATCYIQENLTMEIDIPRYDGKGSYDFDKSKIRDIHEAWTKSGDIKYLAYATDMLKAGVVNLYIYAPEKGRNSGNAVYIGKHGETMTEVYNYEV